MKWDNLTMSQKQALMKIYVNNGVTNLDEIVNHYNRFSEGGSKETVESPNTVLYSRTPRELVSNVVNTKPVPGLITMTEVPRVGVGVNLPIKELINRLVLESKPQNNNINVINTDFITRPVSYITRPNRINRFDDGGVKSRPTRQEYIQSKIEEEKQIALDYSRNRTTPDIPYFDNTQTEEEYNKNKQEDIKRWENYIRNAKEDWVINYAKGNLERVKNEKYNPIISGQSCAYTATGNYSQNGINRRCSGNLTFEDHHKKYGFTPTTKENLSPGDLVQDIDMGHPTHMLTFDSYNEDGTPLYNYARGNAKDIVVKGKYPMDNSLYYTFVGTPEDSARWTKQYFEEYPVEISMATIEDVLNESNKKKYGGKLKKNKK